MKLTASQSDALQWMEKHGEWVSYKKIDAWGKNIASVIALENRGLVERRETPDSRFSPCDHPVMLKEWRAVKPATLS